MINALKKWLNDGIEETNDIPNDLYLYLTNRHALKGDLPPKKKNENF